MGLIVPSAQYLAADAPSTNSNSNSNSYERGIVRENIFLCGVIINIKVEIRSSGEFGEVAGDLGALQRVMLVHHMKKLSCYCPPISHMGLSITKCDNYHGRPGVTP